MTVAAQHPTGAGSWEQSSPYSCRPQLQHVFTTSLTELTGEVLTGTPAGEPVQLAAGMQLDVNMPSRQVAEEKPCHDCGHDPVVLFKFICHTL